MNTDFVAEKTGKIAENGMRASHDGCYHKLYSTNWIRDQETKTKLTARSARLQKCAKKIDLLVNDDEQFNNSLNYIEKTLPVNRPSINPVIDPVNP